VLFLVALAVRGGWGVYRAISIDQPTELEFPDERQYWLMASSFADGDGLRDEFGFRATRMPLYPVLLSPCTQWPSGMLLAAAGQALIGALGAVLAALLAVQVCRLNATPMDTTSIHRRCSIAAWTAGLLVAFDPFQVFFSALFLTETIYTTLTLLLWWVTMPLVTADKPPGWARWVMVGLIAAACVYTRESAVGLIAVLCLFLIVQGKGPRRRIIGSLIVGAVVVMALWPWASRNKDVIGERQWLTTRGGISLYDGVGPQADGSSNLADVQRSGPAANLSEAEWNRYFWNESIHSIRAEPGRILRLAGVKVARLWNPLPNVETYQSSLVHTVSAAWNIPIFALALAGGMILVQRGKGRGRRLTVFLLLPALYATVLHAIFVGSVRYRLPVMPMLEILAAVAIAVILNRGPWCPADPPRES